MKCYPRKLVDQDFEQAEGYGEDVLCQEKDVEAIVSSEQKTGHVARPADYPSVQTNE